MRGVLFIVCLCVFGWCFRSCDPIQSYSEIPEIKFKSLVFDSVYTVDKELAKKALLTFSFIDGDGDIGVIPKVDSTSKIHFTWYKKMPDQTYDPFVFYDGTVSNSANIPYSSVMDKEEAQNKTLKGTIEIALDIPLKPQDVDTMRIEFYIFDRAKNRSNIDYTPDFSILNTSDLEKNSEKQ